SPTFRVDLVVTDRKCGAEDVARGYNIPLSRIAESNNTRFSDELLKLLQREEIDFIFLFFTRLLKGKLLIEYKNRIINFHPSLLPACPGQHGFEDTMASCALFFGSTAHVVDEGMDTGWPIIQAAAKKRPDISNVDYYRHIVFAQQVACFYQVYSWILEGRFKIKESENIYIEGGIYGGLDFFNPSLESTAFDLYAKVARGF